MQRHGSQFIAHGLIGGLMAGAVVATWFLVVDLLAGQPLATPAALAAALLGTETFVGSAGAVIAFTVLHFGVFAFLGIVAGWTISSLGLEPALRHGAVFGIGVLNAVHYGAFWLVGAELASVLPTVHVVLANLAGGMAMMSYLHYASRADTPFGLATLRNHQSLTQGIGIGLVGAAAVAIWFFVLDVATGSPLSTPGALGSLVFLGATSAAEVQVTVGSVAAYTVLHFAAFVVIGTMLVWVAHRIEQTPGLWLLAVMAFILIEVASVGVLGALGAWVLGTVGWLAVLVGNVISVAAMAVMIWRFHPRLREQLLEQPVTTMV